MTAIVKQSNNNSGSNKCSLLCCCGGSWQRIEAVVGCEMLYFLQAGRLCVVELEK